MPLLLHLADVHLGARHLHLGSAAVEQRERQLAAFARAIDEGHQANVDAALICGDLFDSDAQPRRSLERVASELKRLTDAGIRVVIIPGCHDGDSIYRAFDLAGMTGLPPGSELLTLLTPERPELLLRDLDLIIHGRVAATKHAPGSLLEGFSARADKRASWKVGMLHGSRWVPGEVERDDLLFTDAEIASSGLDYLALGHRHSFSTGRAGETTWAYPGAPEPLAVDEDGAGSVCLVRLEDGAGTASSVHVDRVRVGRTVFRAESVDASSLGGRDELVRRLRELADADLVLQASIDGIASDALEFDVDDVERVLAPSFLHVRVHDRSAAGPHAGPDLPTDTVVGQFVADMQSRIRDGEARGDAENAEQARRILRLGRRLLLDDPAPVALP
jgi:DNA repair protein SbcD/Mre11